MKHKDYTLDNVMAATLTAREAAYVLQCQAFDSLMRNVNRSNFVIYPRIDNNRGPGQRDYRYAHLIELALQLTIGATRSGRLSRAVMLALHRIAFGDAALRKVDTLPADEKHGLLNLAPFDPSDFPEGSPHDVALAVKAPQLGFGPDVISRDPSAPTWLLYDPTRAAQGMGRVDLIGDTADLHDKYLALISGGVSGDQEIAHLRETNCDIGLLNLTEMLVPMDRRIASALEFKTIKGR